jgi:apolipoprotein N-acyltransferase
MRPGMDVALSLVKLKTEHCTLANYFAFGQSMALKKISLNSARFAAAALGGLLLSASFPMPGMAWAAWIAPGLILFSSLGAPSGRAFRIGFVAGLVHFLSSLYWLLNMPFTWHGIPVAPGLGWLALSAYCALFPGVWVWLCWKTFPGEPGAEQFLVTSRMRRLAWSFAAGAIWTALEFARGSLLTGFPWNFVGASQYKMLSLIQIAAVTGIYGVSFLVVWTSVTLGGAALTLLRRPAAQSLWTGAGLPLLVVVGVTSFGANKLASVPAPEKELTVALIQPGIPQTEIWDSSKDAARFQTVLDLSERALASEPKPQLMLWPESAVLDLTPEIQQAIGQLVRRHDAWLVFCAATAKAADAGATDYFNSALLCNPDGALESIYNKRRLVIFGEYIPLVHWLPFLKWLTPIGGETTPGDRPVEFGMRNPTAKMSVLICFEDMFAQEAREHAGPDTDFLVNLSNDGWFGHGAEQWQQAASGIFRAVENGVPLLRCTNDGLTCWADAQGRLRQIHSVSGNVYGPGFIIARIPLLAPGDRRQTFYNLHGDWFPAACSGMGLAWLAAMLWSRRRADGPLSIPPRDTVQN